MLAKFLRESSVLPTSALCTVYSVQLRGLYVDHVILPLPASFVHCFYIIQLRGLHSFVHRIPYSCVYIASRCTRSQYSYPQTKQSQGSDAIHEQQYSHWCQRMYG